MNGKPVAIVTGTSSGIGREAATHLAKAGFYVIATARKVGDIADLEAPGQIYCMQLDVTNEAQRAALVEEVLAQHGRIEALVNNAGYGAILAVEDTDAAAMHRMFDVNFFALHELTRLVLPTMRKQGAGRIVNVSSIAGHVSVPLLGAYCATKFALRALTQALDNEVRRFGVRALLIEPGVIKTEFGARSLAESSKVDHEASPYASMYRAWKRRRAAGRGAHPRVIARKIVHACAAASPNFHYFAPLDAKAASLAKRLLPDAWINAGMRLYFRGK